MLRKLIRHEWKRLWKVPALLLIFLQVIAVGAGLTFLEPVYENDFLGLRLLVGLVWTAFFVAVIGVSFAITIYLALQFYKSMYSDEGYLTHTLPVSGIQLLTAKGLVMALWSFISSLGIILSILIFGYVAINCYPQMDWRILAQELQEGLKELQWYLEQEEIRLTALIVPVVLSMLLGLLYNTVLVMGALTIGQLARKHRIPLSFLAGIGIHWLVSSVQSIAQMPSLFTVIFVAESSAAPDITMAGDVYSYMLTSIWIQNVVMAVCTAGLFIFSSYIIRRKLNLE